MKTNYVLIDYESVQPKNLAILNDHPLKDEYPFKVIVFVGANQTKVTFEIAASLQALGDNADYIQISGNGPNALDFHIAYYIGRLAAHDSNVYFHIIARDKGYDPLIKHLNDKKIFAQRHKDLAEIPLLILSNGSSPEAKIDAIVKYLVARGPHRPRKIKTLTNTINALFWKTLEAAEVKSLIEDLRELGHVAIDKENVTYTLPADEP